MKTERYEVWGIDPTIKKKIRKYCIDKNITAAQFVKLGYEALTRK